MADGTVNLTEARARRYGAPPLRVIETSPAGRHEFGERRPSFRPAETLGAVYWGRVRLSPETATAILADFQRDAVRYGDWTKFDELSAAIDGIEPEPPEAA